MIGRLYRRLREHVASGGSGDAENGASGGFAGSMLDWSVNYSHGPDGGRGEAAREMAQIQAKAEMLDEQDRRRR
ncbi:hypothetical protein [Haloarcula laminariae]|uniref:hypothetical protein n=1 Tax=Haloarcula laminariae TaxID=2961577 RepID=UPI0021C8414B|nr:MULTISPECIES: hypothetical protein [Halomicroarcula]